MAFFRKGTGLILCSIILSVVFAKASQTLSEGFIIKDFLEKLGTWEVLASNYGVENASSIEKNYCNLPFITCDRGKVISIILTYSAPSNVLSRPPLRGILSPLLRNLTSLKTLVISGHDVRGPVPPEWAYGFVGLEYMNLTYNLISGTLPSVWGTNGSFASLRRMVLGPQRVIQGLGSSMETGFGLAGVLPGSWGSVGAFSELGLLDLSGNNFNGTIPNGWFQDGSFPKLSHLNLAVNDLTGTLPADLINLVNLETLSLERNVLTGSIPASWASSANWPVLSSLVLQYNHLNGTLPSFNLSKLETLIVAGNSLTGTLPPYMGSPLRFLNLIGNKLTGSLPVTWGVGALPNVEKLYLTDNLLTGIFPAQWANRGTFRNLDTLFLDGNRLSGALPNGLDAQSFPALRALQLSGNALSGTLPDSWGRAQGLPSLQLFGASGNNLTGQLPLSWFQGNAFPKLTHLLLRGNRLSGSLPRMEPLPSNDQGRQFYVLDLAFNNISGPLAPSWPQALTKVQQIFLQNNTLSGTLDDWFPDNQMSWSFLKDMCLSNNNLRGPLPADGLQSFTYPQRVWLLPGNRFCGAIPKPPATFIIKAYDPILCPAGPDWAQLQCAEAPFPTLPPCTGNGLPSATRSGSSYTSLAYFTLVGLVDYSFNKSRQVFLDVVGQALMPVGKFSLSVVRLDNTTSLTTLKDTRMQAAPPSVGAPYVAVGLPQPRRSLFSAVTLSQWSPAASPLQSGRGKGLPMQSFTSPAAAASPAPAPGGSSWASLAQPSGKDAMSGTMDLTQSWGPGSDDISVDPDAVSVLLKIHGLKSRQQGEEVNNILRNWTASDPSTSSPSMLVQKLQQKGMVVEAATLTGFTTNLESPTFQAPSLAPSAVSPVPAPAMAPAQPATVAPAQIGGGQFPSGSPSPIFGGVASPATVPTNAMKPARSPQGPGGGGQDQGPVRITGIVIGIVSAAALAVIGLYFVRKPCRRKWSSWRQTTGALVEMPSGGSGAGPFASMSQGTSNNITRASVQNGTSSIASSSSGPDQFISRPSADSLPKPETDAAALLAVPKAEVANDSTLTGSRSRDMERVDEMMEKRYDLSLDDLYTEEEGVRKIGLGRELGEGSFGKVYLAKYDGYDVAVKVLKEDTSTMQIEALRCEVKIMRHLHSEYLMTCRGASLQRAPYFLVMDYMPYGSLGDTLRGSGRFPKTDLLLGFYMKDKGNQDGKVLNHYAIRFARDVAAGLEFMHRNQVTLFCQLINTPGYAILILS
eukprot:jgi/Botrbrau1/4033/Bobra.0016s0040.3